MTAGGAERMLALRSSVARHATLATVAGPSPLQRLTLVGSLLVCLAIVAWTGFDVYTRSQSYRAWMSANADELARHQDNVKRYERRQSSRVYDTLSAKAYRNDARAAETSQPVIKRMEQERVALFEAKREAFSRFRIGLIVVVVLLLIARGVAQR
jgi:hypothetical protein